MDAYTFLQEHRWRDASDALKLSGIQLKIADKCESHLKHYSQGLRLAWITFFELLVGFLCLLNARLFRGIFLKN